MAEVAVTNMKRSGRVALLTACAVIALTGCVGPNFAPPVPVTATAANFLDTGKAAASPVPVLTGGSGAPTEVQWWHTFRDAELSRLEARVADQNLDVKTATLRLAESRAQRAQTAAAELPTVSGNASDYREQFSKNGLFALIPLNGINTSQIPQQYQGTLGGVQQGVNHITNGFNVYSVGFDASWELDLWGHVARQVEAADAQLLANAEMRRDVLVSSLAEVARDYVNLRGTQAQLRIAQDNIKVEQEILDVTRTRMDKGLVTGLDVESAAAQVESVKAQVPTLQTQLVQGINAISLLLDEPPLGLSSELITPRAIPPSPPRVPVGLPSELARRRPDIRMAEAQLHAATANIGVAIAEFYPSVRLNGSPTLQAIEPRNIFKGSSLQYMNVGPSVTLPIFEGGRLKANLVMQEKSQQEAAVAYHKAVLSAWHDVVNTLTAYKTEQVRREHLRAQVEHAKQALVLARSRYEQGVADITTLLSDAQSVLSAEQQLAQSQTNVSIDLIALFKALGGGWEETYPDPRAIAPTVLTASAAPVPSLVAAPGLPAVALPAILPDAH
ncbi:hypothetical protein RHAL1_03086 [Beijerinckiaceae bacterium RH AL1]|nr:hypothetical protein RHCH11_RHCH11_03023 [Beijerinckiaceae bacterium RH CH11]VVB48054.1 hypothetical protein RHAL8_03019 [Beijerinckiaceae bacterium RH AL8]VVC56160.1 hypothetical protein RHAL1_03086 [Beijerinckiaceae bacterium RH AL1]